MRRLLSAVPTAGLIVVFQMLDWAGVEIPNPQLFLAVAICLAAFRGGWIGGLAAAALATVNAAWVFSLPDAPFTYSTGGMTKVAVNLLCLPAIAALTATLVQRLARAEHDKALSFLRDAEAPIVLLTPEGAIQDWNRGMERLTGVGTREARDRPLEQLVHPGDRAGLRAALGRVEHQETLPPLVLRFPLPGTSLDLPARASCTLHPNRDETGRLLGVILVGQALPMAEAADLAHPRTAP
jgi:PAS domain-containing protein